MGLPQKPPKAIIDSFTAFLELVPARRLNQFISKLLTCYLLNEVEEGIEDCFVDGIKDISNLSDLLDAIDELFDQSELIKSV